MLKGKTIMSAIRVVVCMLLCCFVVCGCGAGINNAAGPFNTLSSDGVAIAYAAYGRGEVAVVFVHGWSCDSRYWYKQVPYFARKYRVVTLDVAGHGNSGFGRKAYTTEAFGQDVAAVLRQLDVKKAILVGHSMCGEVIIYAAKAAPEQSGS